VVDAGDVDEAEAEMPRVNSMNLELVVLSELLKLPFCLPRCCSVQPRPVVVIDLKLSTSLGAYDYVHVSQHVVENVGDWSRDESCERHGRHLVPSG